MKSVAVLALATLSLSLAACHGGTTGHNLGGGATPTTTGFVLATPDHAAGTTVPYRGPCKNPDLQAATGTVERWTGEATFHGLKNLTTMAMGLTGDGSVLFVWAGATNANPHQGLIITNLEPKDFCLSTTFGPMYSYTAGDPVNYQDPWGMNIATHAVEQCVIGGAQNLAVSAAASAVTGQPEISLGAAAAGCAIGAGSKILQDTGAITDLEHFNIATASAASDVAVAQLRQSPIPSFEDVRGFGPGRDGKMILLTIVAFLAIAVGFAIKIYIGLMRSRK